MRYVFTILLVILFTKTFAGDTLTRAQVYSFYNVGDTFDYRTSTFDTVFNPTTAYYGSHTVSYTRYVISNVYWSADTMTEYIVQERIYPAPLTFDTIDLTNLQGYEAFLDTPYSFSAFLGYGIDTIIISSSPIFWGMPTNYLSYWAIPSPWRHYMLFNKGLGLIMTASFFGAQEDIEMDTTQLIYYSGDSGTYGTPYTSFPDAVTNMPDNKNLKLYPTLNDGNFTIESENSSRLPFDVNIYDLQGKKVTSLTIADTRQIIHISDLNTGLYIWKTENTEGDFTIGKMIIQK